MKNLRNIAIYYIILGFEFIFINEYFQLSKLSIIGVCLLIVYLILRGFGVKTLPVNWSSIIMKIWNIFLYIHPILLVLTIIWYSDKQFPQTVVLPKNYEGVVVIDYGVKNGQDENWTDTFLGMGGRRLIKIDKNGYAKTKFAYNYTCITTYDIRNSAYNYFRNMKIVYENDLNNDIPINQGNNDTATEKKFEKHKNNNLPMAFSTQFNEVKNIFVVCKNKDYGNYFYTEKEIQEINKINEGFAEEQGNVFKGKYTKLKK